VRNMATLTNGDAAAPAPMHTADTITADLNTTKRKREDEQSSSDDADTSASQLKCIQKDILEVLTRSAHPRS